jgi:hypothetical protein
MEEGGKTVEFNVARRLRGALRKQGPMHFDQTA